MVLLAEIALVTTGLLDWRVATVVIAVTEGLLTVLGVAAGAALVTQYRRSRTSGRSRTDSLSEAIFFLMPAAMAVMVRRELSFFRVPTLACARRTEGELPGDVLLAYGGSSRKAVLGVAMVLLVSGTTMLFAFSDSFFRAALGVILLYAAVVTTAAGLASKVRPHLLRGDSLLVRWGLHQDLAIPLGSVRAVEVERPQHGRRRAEPEAADCFVVRASGRELIAVRLTEPIAVPARFGRQRPANTIIVPVDDAGAAAVALAAPGRCLGGH